MSTTPRHIPFGIMLQGPGSHMHALSLIHI